MRITTQRKSKKWIVIISIIVALLLVSGAAAIYLYKFNGSLLGWQPFPKSNSTINYSEPTEDQKKAGETVKQETINEDGNKPSGGSGSDQTPAPVPQPNGKSKVDIIITAANQGGGTVQIRSDILAVTNSGTCTLTLTKGTQKVTKTANVQALSSSSTCQGFNVPVSELSPGSWSLALHFENTTLTADVSQAITIQ